MAVWPPSFPFILIEVIRFVYLLCPAMIDGACSIYVSVQSDGQRHQEERPYLEAILLIFFIDCISQPDSSSFQHPIWPSDFPSPLPTPPPKHTTHPSPRKNRGMRREQRDQRKGRGCFSTVVKGLLQTWPCQNTTVHTHTWKSPSKKQFSRSCSLFRHTQTHHLLCLSHAPSTCQQLFGTVRGERKGSTFQATSTRQTPCHTYN